MNGPLGDLVDYQITIRNESASSPALDVVLQAQILELLRELVDENRMGLLLISHDLAVVTEMADRITILRGGEVMETGDTAQTLSAQVHAPHFHPRRIWNRDRDNRIHHPPV